MILQAYKRICDQKLGMDNNAYLRQYVPPLLPAGVVCKTCITSIWPNFTAPFYSEAIKKFIVDNVSYFIFTVFFLLTQPADYYFAFSFVLRRCLF